MDFKIIIDDTFLNLGLGEDLDPIHNKALVSILNDFENGAWREEKFINFVLDNIAETALSHKEREALQSQSGTQLRQAAKNLRLTDSEGDVGKGSELAEIVLYGVMKHKYKALPVVPKIFYKQNTQDPAKGADSVHIIINDDGKFTLWFGEAKFYNSIEDTRLDSIVQSIEHALTIEKLKKENSIITNVSDIDTLDIEPAIRKQIKASLDYKNSIDELKSIINIPILLLHECKLTAAATEMSAKYIDDIKDFHKDRAESYFKKQIAALKELHKYSELNFHLILFPVPEKKPIVQKFLEFVRAFKG